jgi:HD-like signal output (HDOD) protein
MLSFNSEATVQNISDVLLGRGIQLPPQPKVLVEFQELICRGDFSIRELAIVVRRDPGITASLFRVVSSPIFRCSKRCDSIEQVMTILGTKQTFSLVQAVALSSSLSGEEKKSLEVFWQRSQDIAHLASLISAERVSICNIFPEQAYLTGIFLESGSAVLMQRFPTYSKEMALEDNFHWPVLEEEDELFSVDHCSVGYLLARHWKLPEFICRAIQYHHEMPSAELGEVRTLVAILHLAIHFYNISSGVADTVWKKVGNEVLVEVGIDPQGESAFYDEVIEKFLACKV